MDNTGPLNQLCDDEVKYVVPLSISPSVGNFSAIVVLN